MTVIGGVGHTYFLISEFQSAVIAAILVVVIELGVISWVRHRDMDLKRSAALQTGLSGVLVRLMDMLIGNAKAGVKSSSSISTQTSAGAG
jgi:hypothetical protein